MSTAAPLMTIDETEYPESDGKPIAENTVQYRWIVTLQGNIARLLKDDPNAVCLADNFIYPVQYRPKLRQAPDVFVAFGRPKGDRSSYKVWDEGGIFPQVIFEVLSPGNRAGEMARKLLFYEKYGADEYYVFDPDRNLLLGYQRNVRKNCLAELPRMHKFVSPRLRIRFDLSGDELVIYNPNGTRFLTLDELHNAFADSLTDQELLQKQLMQAQQEILLARQDTERLAAKLRALGVDPNQNGH